MTVDEMKDTLTRLGVSVHDVRGDEIQITCPAHRERTGKEDRNPSLWINADSGAFICFSCQWKGNLYTLVEQVGGVAPSNARSWVATGPGLLARFQRLVNHKEAKREEEPAIIHESMLSAFVGVPTPVCLSRGLLPDIAWKYGVRWNANDKSWIIPIREPLTNKLIGWQEKGHERRTFKNTSRVKKSDALFGYDLYEGGDMIVVESPLDVVRLASVGISGGVAAYGCAISQTQFNIIRGAGRVIFALDNDKAGNQATRDMRKLAKEYGLDCWFFNYSQTDQKDVGGMSKAEIVWGIENATHILRS
jgi:5S rRNA maturation endonuclease (ribonuclease M5)